jgi:hypothetical protein
VIPKSAFGARDGVPVITRDSPAIRDSRCGTSAVLCGIDGAAIAAAIIASRDDFTRLRVVGHRGREAFVKHASHSLLAEQFLEALHVR